MNCPRCHGTGEVTPLEGPTEVCACQEAEAKELFESGTWSDLANSCGDVRHILSHLIEEKLPQAAWLASDLDIVIDGLCILTPQKRALIQAVIAAVNAAAESVK